MCHGWIEPILYIPAFKYAFSSCGRTMHQKKPPGSTSHIVSVVGQPDSKSWSFFLNHCRQTFNKICTVSPCRYSVYNSYYINLLLSYTYKYICAYNFVVYFKLSTISFTKKNVMQPDIFSLQMPDKCFLLKLAPLLRSWRMFPSFC